MILRSAGKVRLVGVRFLPWGFVPCFRAPMHRLRDRVLPFSDLVGPEAATLADWLAGAPAAAAAAGLQDYLARRLDPAPLQKPPDIVPLARAIFQGAGAVQLRDIGARSGLSPRQLERKFNFRRYFEMTPQDFRNWALDLQAAWRSRRPDVAFLQAEGP